MANTTLPLPTTLSIPVFTSMNPASLPSTRACSVRVITAVQHWHLCFPDSEGLDDAAELVGDADLLRTLGETLLAVLAGAGPGLSVGQGLAIALDELLLALGIVSGRRLGQWEDMTVHSLVVIGEVARDIHTVRTRHTVFAGCAGYGRHTRHLVGNLRQQRILCLRGSVGSVLLIIFVRRFGQPRLLFLICRTILILYL